MRKGLPCKGWLEQRYEEITARKIVGVGLAECTYGEKTNERTGLMLAEGSRRGVGGDYCPRLKDRTGFTVVWVPGSRPGTPKLPASNPPCSLIKFSHF